MPFNSNHILLDAACMEDKMYEAKELNKNHSSLYKGRSEEDLADVAPYLFELGKGSDFEKWFIENGWGNSWGVLIGSDHTFQEMFSHFRKFLIVKTENEEEEEELYFRFYDPRVLRIFLPTCDEKQLREFFGPVEHFICEDEDPEYALVFSFEKNQLQTQRISKEAIFDLTEANKTGRKFFI